MMDSITLAAFADEMQKIANVFSTVGNAAHAAQNVAGQAVHAPAPGLMGRIGRNLTGKADLHDVAGLGVLALPSVDTMQGAVRARLAGDKSPDAIEHRSIMGGPVGHAAIETAGLGYLAAPAIAHRLQHGAWGSH